MEKKEKISRFTIDIPIEKHKRLKTLAAMHSKSMREIVIESIEHQLQKLESKATEIIFKQEI